MSALDRSLGWFLVLGGLLHAFGSWAGYRGSPETLVWALSGSLAALLLAAVNLLRVGRPADRQLACVSLAGSVAWVAIAVAFGVAVGNVFDARAVVHAVVAAGLVVMSARTVARGR